ncbi:ROK family protein [Actinoplanes sp. NPDC051851]|uniref:ROK family protein n=1 Tax=Actinoplanes sp. NPDC051851 TaxID=3154753 RepID=UPI003426BED4
MIPRPVRRRRIDLPVPDPRRGPESAAVVLRALLHHGPIARSSIARVTRLSAATVTGGIAAIRREHQGTRRIVGLGLATGGWVDTADGTVVEHPFLGWRDVPMGALLAAATGLPVWADTNSQALLRAEQLFGEAAAQARESAVHLFAGNVVDVAFATGGVVHEGPRSAELSAAGVTVAWANISGGPQSIQAFRADKLDCSAVADIPSLFAAWTGTATKIVFQSVTIDPLENPVYRLGVAPGVTVNSLADLRGKKIAYSAGQAQGALVLRVLQKAGLTRKDVQLVELTSTGDSYVTSLGTRAVDVAPLGQQAVDRPRSARQHPLVAAAGRARPGVRRTRGGAPGRGLGSVPGR